MPSWIKSTNDKYIVIAGNKACKVEEKRGRFIFNCSEEEFYGFWFNYFDVLTDYSALQFAATGIDRTMNIFATRASGVRILRQPVWDVLLQATAGDHFKDLVRIAGKKHKNGMGEVGQVSWHEIPSAEDVLGHREALAGAEFAQSIILCEKVVSGEFDVESLRRVTNSREALGILVNVLDDRKQARRVCLYGLGFKDIAYVEWDVKWILEREYGLPAREYKKLFIDKNCKSFAALPFLYLKYNAVHNVDDIERIVIRNGTTGKHKKTGSRKQYKNPKFR